MADMTDDLSADARVQVQIAGRTYTLRGSRDPGAVRELAAYVDGKMSEIAQRTRTADTTRLAILAALNIAAERHGTAGSAAPRPRPTAATCAHEARDKELCRILDSALAG